MVIVKVAWLRVCAFARWVNGIDKSPTELEGVKDLQRQVDRERFRP